MNQRIRVGLITVSDRAAAGEYEDQSGPALRRACGEYGWDVIAEAIIPDEEERIRHSILSFSRQGCGLVLSSGGTGISARDVTPEAIRTIMRVEIPGFGETMRRCSLEITPNGILSRGLAAVVERSLVIALPGNPGGAVECLGFVQGAIPHAVKLALGEPTSC